MRRNDYLKPLRILSHTAPPASGLVYQGSNKTAITHTTGKLCFVCQVCGISFLKHAAHAKRDNNHSCSRACAAELRKVRVITHCVICHTQMEQTPSRAACTFTCSKKCSSVKRRSLNGHNPAETKVYRLSAYLKKVKEISDRMECIKCGRKHGPWAVRGITVDIDEHLVPHIHDETAELWCRHCQLQDSGHFGALKTNSQKTKKAPPGIPNEA